MILERLTQSPANPDGPAQGGRRLIQRQRKLGVERTPSGHISQKGKSRSVKKPGVYFLRIEGFPLVKVGVASNIDRRQTGIQNGSPFKVVCIGWIDAGTKEAAHIVEKRIHATLKKGGRHVRREWFAIQPSEVRMAEKYGMTILDEIAAQGA